MSVDAEFRAFLTDVRMRATLALMDDFARIERASMQHDETADPADVHEDIRETLWEFFEEIRHRVEGPGCPLTVWKSELAGIKCSLLEGHEGECVPW